MSALWSVLFSWLPAWAQVVLLGLVALVVILLVLRIVSKVLDAIPFL